MLDLNGKRLSVRDIQRRLEVETPVIVSVSGKMPDRYYLQCTRVDALVIVLGIPASPAPQLLPNPRPPAPVK